jgi:4-amino-4-deoxy-L-arabinose transferase-like glycosyltransferase
MRRFLFLLALFITGTLIQSRVLPPMEGSDEPLHVTYVATLRTDRALPDRGPYLENCTRQQSGQPPLMYALGAALLESTRAPLTDCNTIFDHYLEDALNPWALSVNPYRRDDNNRNFLPIQTLSPPEGFPQSVYRLRLISIVFGALAVTGAYLTAGEVVWREDWRLTTTAIFAFTPTLFHVSSYFTNDTPAIAFTTLAMWQTLALLRRGTTTRRLVMIGLLLGLGGLAKVSVLLAAPAVAVAVIWRIWRDHGQAVPAFIPTIRAGLVIALPMLLTFGVWAGYGLIVYGDPFGTATHAHPTLRYDPPLDWASTLRTMPDVYLTTVGLLGYANVYMGTAAYVAMTAVFVLAAVGYVVPGDMDNMSADKAGLVPTKWAMVIVLVILWIVTFIGFLNWYRTIFDVTGRLLLPAHIAVVIAVTVGLARLARVVPGMILRGVAVGSFASAGLILTFVSLQAAYSPHLTDDLPVLSGPTITFDDTVRLLGYHTDSEQLSDEVQTVKLCWEVLQPTDRYAAYAVRYVKDGVAVANRTTVHGLGRYNSTIWEPGAVFCDAVDLAVGDEAFGAVSPEPGVTYDLLVFMLDAQTGDVNWTARTDDGTVVPFPVLGQARYD